MEEVFRVNFRSLPHCTILLIFKFNLCQVRSTDSLKLLKKVEDVRFIVNQELGFVTRSKTVVHLESESVPSSKTTYLCIYNSRVVGMIIVEGIQKAYRLLLVNPDFDTSNEIEIATKMTKPKSDTQVCQLERSTVCQPATLGVHILWVHSNYRNLGIARRLLDIAREKMFYGFVVPVEFLAFSSPTQAGALFAVRYCSPLKNERNTLSGCNVLVYDCQ